MELIIGGAYQGKHAYARELHPEIVFLDGETCTREELLQCRGVWNFQEFIRRQLKEEQDVQAFALELVDKNPGIVVVSTEVGYGVVPIDAFDRNYREAVGRVCTCLAAHSEKVTRVLCGIGTVIKG